VNGGARKRGEKRVESDGAREEVQVVNEWSAIEVRKDGEREIGGAS